MPTLFSRFIRIGRLTDDVLAAVPSRSLAFGVTTDYVLHMLGVRVRS